MKGVAQSSLSLKVYYPDRIGLTMDGPISVSSDLGKSWEQIKKPIVTVTKKNTPPFHADLNIFAGDMDLSANMPPKTILGFVHHGELFGGTFVQTTDGGEKWDWSPPVLRDSRCWLCTGVASASTLLCGEVKEEEKTPPKPGIFLSPDLGQTWEKVSDYTLPGTCPVHYSPNIYWTAREGIVWNGTVKHLQIQMPPGALNLTIGCKGEPHKTHSKKSFFSASEPVTPASLYLAQLRGRRGDAAVKNIGD